MTLQQVTATRTSPNLASRVAEVEKQMELLSAPELRESIARSIGATVDAIVTMAVAPSRA